MGPNGAGKSSLVRIVLGLLSPTQGVINREKSVRIGYTPQKFHFSNFLNVDVESFLKLHPRVTKKDLEKAIDLLKIESLLKRSLHVLSGGERQKVLMARALIGGPNVLVLDEPLSGVDVAGQSILGDLIVQLVRQEKMAVLLVSHDLHFVLAQSDQVICLNGHICCAGCPKTVVKDPSYQALFSVHGAFVPYNHAHDHCDHEGGEHSD
ncbi:uncharacterized protein LOC111320294 [Stylophora pistillata]|uniref:uncharacterized protein LOC111320294 n=1 Tax=Stylophora pistillata TaxID=50429 RepID=UPI000C04BA7A|nr:uncharacterized protein LOC111320294 [Stylophora pistillata]